VWSKNADLVTLFLSLHEEIKSNAKPMENKDNAEFHSEADGHKNWKYVADSHSDWKMKDVEQLNVQLNAFKLEQARKDAMKEIEAE
jgi:hypothetical protein